MVDWFRIFGAGTQQPIAIKAQEKIMLSVIRRTLLNSRML
jgi:hypothetical protein